NIVPANVRGIRHKARPRRQDLGLIGRESCPRVAIENAGEPVNSVGRIGLQGSTQELIVKPRAEDPALRFVETGAEVVVVLDVRDQLLDLSGTGLTGRYRLELVVDRVALGQEGRPEIGLCLVVLVVRNGSCEIGRNLSESAVRTRSTVATRSSV